MHVGEIRLFAGDYEPDGWAWCDGRTLDPRQRAALFQKIGTTYGGDGQTTFKLPDLRGRAPMHRASGRGLGFVGLMLFDSGEARLRARTAINYIIGLEESSRYPDITPIVGEVRLWAIERVPLDWAACAGQLVPISANSTLFVLLREAFGGDGRETFGLPDLRGAFAIHPITTGGRGERAGAAASEGNTKLLVAMQYCIAMRGIFPPRSS